MHATSNLSLKNYPLDWEKSLFLYESDIQYALLSALRERISWRVDVPRTGGGQYVLNLVYSEYLDKIDIACLDPEAISVMNASILTPYKGYDTYIYSLPIFLGIELKYVWMGYKKGFNILERDYLKLTQNSVKLEKIKNWVVLGFIQRNEEATPFLEDAKKQCRLISLSAVENLNDMYIVTPKHIFTVKHESQ